MSQPKKESQKTKHNRKHAILKRMIVALGVTLLVLVIVEGVLLLLISRQVLTYRQYWQQLADKRPQSHALLYIALGDSAAQGVGATRPENGYVGLLAQELSKKFKQPVHVVNLSVSGARAADVLKDQLPELTRQLRPGAIVTLAVGANDIINDDMAHFEQDLDQLLSKLPKQTIVANLPYFGHGRHRHLEPQVQTANKVIERLAKKHKLRLAPLYQTVKEGGWLGVYSADLMHPSNKGYKDWFEAFWHVLGGGSSPFKLTPSDSKKEIMNDSR